MNQFFQCVQLIKDRLDANPNVNTVAFGPPDLSDLEKKNIYPLAIVNPTEASMDPNGFSTFSFEIAAFDQRNISPNLTIKKFYSNDDLQENLNTMFTVINDLVTYLNFQNNDYNIELESASPAIPRVYKEHNILDCWLTTIKLRISNTQSSC